ncbi:MAG: class I SAM-dependent methyltransferase [Armatimonadota bacterium]
MTDIDNQVEYWDSVVWVKEFTLSLDTDRFKQLVSPDQRILDYGCGYGRICRELWDNGYRNIIGIDSSPKMIERAKQEHPQIEFDTVDFPKLPYADESFDAVLLIAVLTCIPSDEGQVSLVQEISRVLKPGGIFYIADFCLQTDNRNLKRYKECEKAFGRYGVFKLPYGVVLRHHDMEWIESLTSNFGQIGLSEGDVSTMNGNPARAFQYFGRKK